MWCVSGVCVCGGCVVNLYLCVRGVHGVFFYVYGGCVGSLCVVCVVFVCVCVVCVGECVRVCVCFVCVGGGCVLCL